MNIFKNGQTQWYETETEVVFVSYDEDKMLLLDFEQRFIQPEFRRDGATLRAKKLNEFGYQIQGADYKLLISCLEEAEMLCDDNVEIYVSLFFETTHPLYNCLIDGLKFWRYCVKIDRRYEVDSGLHNFFIDPDTNVIYWIDPVAK